MSTDPFYTQRLEKENARMREALEAIQEEVEDNIDYCSETGSNMEGRIWGLAEFALKHPRWA